MKTLTVHFFLLHSLRLETSINSCGGTTEWYRADLIAALAARTAQSSKYFAL